jgi:methylase of polypeptide subunit release factors
VFHRSTGIPMRSPELDGLRHDRLGRVNDRTRPLDAAGIAGLRADLIAADYTLDAVSARLGAAGLGGLARNSSMAAQVVLANAQDLQADLIRLWLLAQPVPEARVRAALSQTDELVAAGLLVAEGEAIRAEVELKPYGDELLSAWICADQTPLDGRSPRPRTDFVLGASPASTTLAQLIPRAKVGRVLDLGTGCGIQALHLASHADQIVVTDLNPRALELARITLGLAGVSADFRLGSLYEPVSGEGFDLIVTNPPYVISPPQRSELVYREGTETSDGLMRRVVAEAGPRLNPGGTLIVLGNWAITDQPWAERLAGWVPSGADALVLQREVLDVYEYIELWLADAGLAGGSEYAQRYAEWLDYFAACGIKQVGMGWFALHNGGRRRPEVRFEDWPHAVHQPVGAAFADFFAAIEPARLFDDQLLATCWQIHPELIQETFAAPGAADPEHLILRQHYGFGRATEPGTALAAVVGACDGDLPLGVLIAAVADLLGVDSLALQGELLPQVRTLVAQGYLQPTS